MAEGELTIEQKIKFHKKRLFSLGEDIKSTCMKGRLITTDPNAISTFKGMFRALDSNFTQFNDAWNELQKLYMLADKEKEFPSETDSNCLKAVKAYYYEAGGIHDHLTQVSQVQSDTIPTHSNDTSINQSFAVKMRLPRIEIIKFSGQLKDWPLFRDTFSSLIHDESSHTDMEKYHYLMSNLEGQALSVIKHIPFTQAGYEQAWAALIKHYDNKRLLASHYLDKILSVKPLSGKPTAASLNNYLQIISESVTALEKMRIPNAAQYFLFELAIRCLDPTTREAFETRHTDKEFPVCDDLIEFIRNKTKALVITEGDKSSHDEISDNKSTCSKPPPSPSKYNRRKGNKPSNNKSFSSFFTKTNTPNRVFNQPNNSIHGRVSTSTTPPKCFLCNQSHKLTDCPNYTDITPEQRFDLLKNWAGCKNCLFPGHRTRNCTSSWKCRTCGGLHHTTLHLSKPISNQASNNSSSIVPSTSSNGMPKESVLNAFTGLSAHYDPEVVLGTAIAQISDINGIYHKIRLVIDSGSQHSLITDACATKLGLKRLRFQKTISGLNQSTLCKPDSKVECRLRSYHSSHAELGTVAVVVPSIAPQLPQRKLSIPFIDTLKQISLADPEFSRPASIDFLLGADLFLEIIVSPPVFNQNGDPKLLNTIFGHVIMGKCDEESIQSTISAFCIAQKPNLDSIMQRFWEVEEVKSEVPALSKDEYYCEDHFKNSHTRDSDGRYVVSLPFKDSYPQLGPSNSLALKRLHNLENKLNRDPILQKEYHAFMQEYLDLGHMVEVNTLPKYTIPHHGVHKVVSGVPKIRVVFDASARTSGGSLNDHLLAGPKLQKDIGEILLNFRRHRFVITADIVKMYRQILVSEEDRAYQHILWRFDQNQPVRNFELNTVTYGLKSSPFLALRVIQQLVIDEGDNFPLASHSISHDIYIDDIVTGSPTTELLLKLKEQLIVLLAKGGFKLSKWTTNCPEVVKTLETESLVQPFMFSESEDLAIKILGLQWDPSNDVFTYSIQLPSLPPTKRSILSSIARIYDPLGYLAPTVFLAKYLLQEIWKSGMDWDDIVPANIQTTWEDYVRDIPKLKQISIPRYLYLDQPNNECSIIGFCDASERGYCAVLYLVIEVDHIKKRFLLKAKTKLAPVKPLTIPRLELCAALLLAQLYNSLNHFLDHLRLKSVWFFTDSATVLSWLVTPAHNLKTFVAHRVVRVSELTDISRWRHICSSENPADCGSRGLFPSQLIDHHLWWAGPTWLTHNEQSWPVNTETLPKEELPEIKSGFTLIQASDFVQWTERFSKYRRLINSFAYVNRFKPLSKFTNKCRPTGPISAAEFDAATIKCIKLLQQFFYPEAFNPSLKPTPLLLSLNTFIDQIGLLRVGGRLRHADIPDHTKFPILLPKRSHFTNVIIDYFHQQHAHSGPATTLSAIQQQYWIPSGRSLVKQRKYKCLVCFRATKKHFIPRMGDLPPERLTSIRPFFNTGVDFAGPFLCKESPRRNAPARKAYLCLFVCLSTKAVHLELASSLSTEAFIDALDRFIARRGKPSRISSDCGRNFTGTANYLADLEAWHDSPSTRNRLIEHVNHQHIEWHFNPPYAPHFGGIWEAGVKSTKTLLRKIIGNSPFTSEELSTLFTKVEAILNSRPLQPLSSDPEDLQPLTPGHFLVGGPLTALPEADVTEVPSNRLNRWQYLRERIQNFWHRWRTQYIQTLQQRHKWRANTPNVQKGDLVLLKQTKMPPMQWPLARVLEVYPGADKVVRVVTLKTAQGICRRPVTKLLPLLQLSEAN